MAQKYKTGDTAPEERIIPLSRGETFPPVKSCGSRGGAYWQKED